MKGDAANCHYPAPLTRHNTELLSWAASLEGALDRVTGARLVRGKIRLLRDATENYPAWIRAIEDAKDRIVLESYIIHEDEQGYSFADLLMKKARQGLNVKIIYDWLGGIGKTSNSFWRMLQNAGIEVRCFNALDLLNPIGVLNRDHRKTLVVDGQTAFISGLCIGSAWLGDPKNNISPWRDTGVQISGPAVSEIEATFVEVWSTMGEPLCGPAPPLITTPSQDNGWMANLRIVKSSPGDAHVYRTDQLLNSLARRQIWLSDAYFVSIPSYLQSLIDASRDGIDVRILMPRSTDIRWIRETTRSTYRPLLQAGVRVYEWNGSMMHAKTAVFDGHFARVGSSNLNIASWFGNYELDVLVEDDRFGRDMQEMFLRDVASSTEIVLNDTLEKRSSSVTHKSGGPTGSGSIRKTTAGALRAATSLSRAIASETPLRAPESRLLLVLGIGSLVLAALLIKFPRGAAAPFVILLCWLGVTTVVKGLQNYWRYH